MRLTEDNSNKLYDIITPIVEAIGLELVEVSLRKENQRHILAVVIDKEGGISVDDCAKVSGKLSLILDIEDLIQHKYYLEVGSPGIFRELKTEKEFKSSLNKRVKAVFTEPVEGQAEFIGDLKGIAGGLVTLSNKSQSITIDLERIKMIQLYPDI